MAKFKFGEIRADVNRLGPMPENPQLDVYSVRLTAPNSEDWIESRIIQEQKPRSAGSDFFLAAVMLSNMEVAARVPELWATTTQRLREVSPEEIAATLEMAKRLEPYLEEAGREAHDRFQLYGEHWESGVGPLELGISRPLQLPKRIRTKEDIANFFAYLLWVEGTSLDPDEDFNMFVDRTGAPTYTTEEGHERNRLMAEAWDVARKEKLNIYDLSIWVNTIFDNANVRKVPKWMIDLSSNWI